MSMPLSGLRNNFLYMAIRAREPSWQAKKARRANRPDQRTPSQRVATLLISSGKQHILGEIHPSDLRCLRRRPVRDPSATGAVGATLPDGKKPDNNPE